jgi:hypothetical protein
MRTTQVCDRAMQCGAPRHPAGTGSAPALLEGHGVHHAGRSHALVNPVDTANAGLSGSAVPVARLLYTQARYAHTLRMCTYSRHTRTAFDLQVLPPVGAAMLSNGGGGRTWDRCTSALARKPSRRTNKP